MSSNARILVVDDDPLVRATISAGLRDAGYSVNEAGSGEEAVTACASSRHDLAILDMRMPHMSGVDAAREINRTTLTPFIFLTAFDDQVIVEQAVAEGALGYLVKPVDVHQVIPTIEAALLRAAELRALQNQQENLNVALHSGRETSVAIGLIMAETGLDAEAAERALRQYCRSQRCKMTEMANRLVEARETYTQLMAAIRNSTQSD
jgi:response regulator NasT